MTVLMMSLCLLIAAFCASGEDSFRCSRTMEGACALEEGLEMLQSRAAKLTAQADTSIVINQKHAPQLPESLSEETYESYVAEVRKSIMEPATEYKYNISDTGSANYSIKGLCMSPDGFPALKKQIEDIVDNGIAGDIYETGTWRGGSSIYMLAVLRAYEKLRGKEESSRLYYGFDSFEGFQPRGENQALDDYLSKAVYKAPLENVRASFDKFGLLDDRVHFVKGYFEDTVPDFTAPNPIAILRLDGDLYSSTKVVLEYLQPKVQTGGWTVIDDYTWKPPEGEGTKLCKEAVDEYRAEHNITARLTAEVSGSWGKPSWKTLQSKAAKLTAQADTSIDTNQKHAPKLPESLSEETYESYVAEVRKSIMEPATEYKYNISDTGSANYSIKGLCMSPDGFPALKKQIEDIVDKGIAGDIYETGTWRGGSSIYMLAVLRAYEKLRGKEESSRLYYGFDSFEGFQPRGENQALDDYLSKAVYKAPLENVRASFDKFGLLDDRVHFVKGYFEDTMPDFTAPNPIAILRLDGDLYTSTKVVLEYLQPKVQTGGWIVIDDYTWKPPEGEGTKLCKEAVDEYRAEHNITARLTAEVSGSWGKPSWNKV